MNRTVIWGTSVSIADTKTNFRSFINTFTDDVDGEPKYERMIAQLGETGRNHLNVDCRDLKEVSAAHNRTHLHATCTVLYPA